MAEDLVVGAVYDHFIRTSLGAQWGINQRYAQCISIVGPGFPTTLDLAVALDLRYATPYKDVMSQAATYDFISTRRVSGIAPLVLSSIGNASTGIGNVLGDPLPKQVAGLISFYANPIGKRYRGRSFIPFPGEVDSGAGAFPSGGYLTRLTALAQLFVNPWSFLVGATTVNMEPCIWPGNQALPTERVVQAVPHQAWATQRRRGDFSPKNR